MDKWVVKKLRELRFNGEMWRMMKRVTACARSAVMLDG